MTIRPIQASEIRQSAALHTAQSGLHEFEYAARQEVWLRIAEKEGIDLSSQVVAEEAGKLLGACLYQVNPGRAAMVFAPAFGRAGWQAELAVTLIRAAAEATVAGGASLCESLLSGEGEATGEAAFREAGFHKLASLLHMERAMPVRPILTDALRYESYGPDSAEKFAEVIGRTYEGTLDCPELNGRRRIEDVIASHQATGVFDPTYWLLARSGGQAVGCLLLNRCRFRPAWEIVYVAVLPEQRGKGYGEQLVGHGLTIANVNEATAVVLAVDAANAPAVRIYRRLGFETHHRTVAMVRFAETVR